MSEQEGEYLPAVAQTEVPARIGALVPDIKDPQATLDRYVGIARVLAAAIEDRKLYKKIGASKHVYVEGWTTLGTMLGVFTQVQWVRWDDDLNAFVARVHAVTLDNELVGAAEMLCSYDEDNWAGKPKFQLHSMAQTRATGKALRLPLSFVMELAGYAPTPAEEMMDPEVQAHSQPAPSPQRHAPPGAGPREAPAPKPPKYTRNQQLLRDRFIDLGEKNTRIFLDKHLPRAIVATADSWGINWNTLTDDEAAKLLDSLTNPIPPDERPDEPEDSAVSSDEEETPEPEDLPFK